MKQKELQNVVRALSLLLVILMCLSTLILLKSRQSSYQSYFDYHQGGKPITVEFLGEMDTYKTVMRFVNISLSVLAIGNGLALSRVQMPPLKKCIILILVLCVFFVVPEVACHFDPTSDAVVNYIDVPIITGVLLVLSYLAGLFRSRRERQENC